MTSPFFIVQFPRRSPPPPIAVSGTESRFIQSFTGRRAHDEISRCKDRGGTAEGGTRRVGVPRSLSPAGPVQRSVGPLPGIASPGVSLRWDQDGVFEASDYRRASVAANARRMPFTSCRSSASVLRAPPFGMLRNQSQALRSLFRRECAIEGSKWQVPSLPSNLQDHAIRKGQLRPSSIMFQRKLDHIWLLEDESVVIEQRLYSANHVFAWHLIG